MNAANDLRPMPPPAGPTRAARRQAKLQRKVQSWWDAQPADTRRVHYLGTQLAQLLGIATHLLGPVLRSLGWRRDQVRLGERQVGVWTAPGAPSIKRPRGRPRLNPQTPGDIPHERR